MCRMLGYLGTPLDLATLLVAPPHGLLEQSWAPRRQQHGTVNADGWGVGWYATGREEPARYRSVLPMWSDPHLTTLLPAVRADLLIGAVRGATAPSATQLSNTPPYAHGPWLLAHNGAIEGWHDGVGERLRRSLTPARAAGLQGNTDSELLLALFLDLRASLPAHVPVSESLAATITRALHGTVGRVNLLLSDGKSLWATRCGDSLWLAPRDDGTLVASEPSGDETSFAEAGWREVTEHSIVTLARTDGAVDVSIDQGGL